jgi:hypothetical protein
MFLVARAAGDARRADDHAEAVELDLIGGRWLDSIACVVQITSRHPCFPKGPCSTSGPDIVPFVQNSYSDRESAGLLYERDRSGLMTETRPARLLNRVNAGAPGIESARRGAATLLRPY